MLFPATRRYVEYSGLCNGRTVAEEEKEEAEGGEEDDMDEILEEMCVVFYLFDVMSLKMRAKGMGGARTESETDRRKTSVEVALKVSVLVLRRPVTLPSFC